MVKSFKISTDSKMNSANGERQQIDRLINYQMIDISDFIAAGYENVRDRNTDIAIAIRLLMDNYEHSNFVEIYNSFKSLYNLLKQYNLLTIHKLPTDYPTLMDKYASYKDNTISFSYNKTRGTQTFRLSLLNNEGNEFIRFEYDNTEATLTSIAPNDNVEIIHIFRNNQYIVEFAPQYLEIPNIENYKINRLAPYNIKGPRVSNIFKPQTEKYFRIRLGNKVVYYHRLIAWVNQIDGYQKIKFNMTRAEYNKRLHYGILYVIDHIDNNPANNDPSNLRITTQAQNLARRH